MIESTQPLAEVFGHVLADATAKANRYRSSRLCPFNNKVPNCTKDKAKNPLGVCSILHKGSPEITCPIRFREDWLITDDAASFFFDKGIAWSSLTEVRLNDANGKAAGNIDIVLVAYDEEGKVFDFGALEVQAVYISGNVRDPFEHYMRNPIANAQMDWSTQPNYPRPDYLSSSRKRLAPQLLFKGGIIHSWQKKSAVALNKSSFDTFPRMPQVRKEEADIAWIIYDLKSSTNTRLQYELFRERIVYTKRQDAPPEMNLERGEKVEDFLFRIETELENIVV